MGRSLDAQIVAECAGCVKVRGEKCAVILEPAYFWARYGHCFARLEDLEEWHRILKACEEYALRRQQALEAAC
ncbi:MAG: hypothetical protein ACPLRW_04680 [Moorellales bacterium]